MSDGIKQCPFCAEDIKEAAIVCKHCGRDLPSEVLEFEHEEVVPAKENKQKKKNSWVIVIIVIIVLFSFPCIICQFSGDSLSDLPDEPTITIEPTAASLAPPIYRIFASGAGMTDAQLNNYIKSLKGTIVENWEGDVVEVDEHEILGGFTVYVNMVETKYWKDVHFSVSEEVALSLNKDQHIVFSGVISDVDLTELGGKYVSLRNATISTETRTDSPTPYPRYTPESGGMLDSILDFLSDH
jgi:hypothetical protein